MTTLLRFNSDLNFKSNLKIPIVSNNFIVEHKIDKNFHNLKCYKSFCIYKYFKEPYKEENLIFSLDFTMIKENQDMIIHIDNLYVNNDYYDVVYNNIFIFKRKIILKENQTKYVIESLMKFVENIANKEKINKIIIDIYSNLERYEYELKELGFIIKHRVNSYWIQAEKIILKNEISI
jgi:hypothetical protein